ncbi:hypothetical protein C8Q70DRAFT_936619 [Cubamyces menziesii]|uniref:Uncharacterized protein n=1 Tax=Trametes cubensis TaxID=1111947 RepID=A0AAD7TWG8_9APHY|nr:hypothetical protein C8Q70DRAFT_936619 [Cubamyces menziesii]KAJ8482311.1 hypothetical protein ONZ51_g5430 [Trametes cubensis]
MRRPYSSATLAILVSTYAVSTLSIPLPDPVYVGQEQDPHTLVPPSHRHEPLVESRVNPYHSIADKAPSALHPVQIDAREMEAASRRSSTVPNSNMPFVPPRILARNSAYDPSTETCRVALDMLERDYAGHGLPLTSLVIESSTLLLLVAFVVYFVIGRCKARRQQLRLFTSSPTLFQPSTASRDSIVKTSLIPTAHPLSKIDEDSHSSNATHSPCIQTSPSSPVPSPLCPQRGPPPPSPSRVILRSPSCTNVSTPSNGLEKKASFLSLKG